jgi:Uma2 family endonuclease
MSALAIAVASRLGHRLAAFLETQPLGQVVHEAIFRLSQGRRRRQRRPDVAFISRERWPLDRPIPATDPWQVVPDLAIEVVSPNDLAEDLEVKRREYLRAGVRAVWIVSPLGREVTIYTPGQVRLLTEEMELDGGDVLTGFRLPLANLFPPAPPEADDLPDDVPLD